jgi:hypothetical protein
VIGYIPPGSTTPLDIFRHKVNLDMYVLQPSVSFAASDNLNIELRLPLRRLVRRAEVIPFPGATPENKADMQRHLDLHHPSRTLTGIGDLQIEMHSPEAPQWRWGFSLPTGHTEPNPYVLGEGNEAHEHVQFGTGTVVPRGMYVWAQDNYMMSTAISLPLYANSHGFTPPAEFNFYAGLRKEFSSDWRWSVGSTIRAQGYGDWSGTRDVNTGYAALLADVALTNVTENGSWHYGMMIPLVQELFSDGSDIFEFGTTFAVTFSPVWGD